MKDSGSRQLCGNSWGLTGKLPEERRSGCSEVWHTRDGRGEVKYEGRYETPPVTMAVEMVSPLSDPSKSFTGSICQSLVSLFSHFSSDGLGCANEKGKVTRSVYLLL